MGSTQTVTGFGVEAVDGSTGEIDEASSELSSADIVVDTGWWSFGERRLIPAGLIERVDLEGEKMFVALTKEQIKSAPKYEPDRFTDDTSYRGKIDEYYSRY